MTDLAIMREILRFLRLNKIPYTYQYGVLSIGALTINSNEERIHIFCPRLLRPRLDYKFTYTTPYKFYCKAYNFQLLLFDKFLYWLPVPSLTHPEALAYARLPKQKYKPKSAHFTPPN